MIPVSVLITTFNEEDNLGRCLENLQEFNEVIIIDSNSDDKTKEVAKEFGVSVVNFTWNGKYPKKRQWCLDNLNLKNDFVFFLDADERVTSELIKEMQSLSYSAAGYFIKGKYVWNNKPLKYGLKNNKLALFNRHKIMFPVVNDLDIESMGEMEGHYQPILKPEYKKDNLDQMQYSLLHYAYEDRHGWIKRHMRYSKWEANMIVRDIYPKDPNFLREKTKSIFRKIFFRPAISFMHSYIIKFGFLDGAYGFLLAKSRYTYYSMVSDEVKNLRLSSNKVAR